MNEPSEKPDDLSFCETLVREEDHDRFLATLFAPAAARPWLYALYAFDLETARVASRVSEPLAGEIRLQWWHDVVSGGREQAAGSPVASALAALIERTPGATDGLLTVIEARREQLYATQGGTLLQLEERFGKCDGAIFELATLLLDVPPGRDVASLCRHAGIAFGLTRYLEASDEASETAAVALADRHLGEARGRLRDEQAIVWPAFLVLALVRPTLASLEHGGRLLQWRKQWVLWRAARNLPARI